MNIILYYMALKNNKIANNDSSKPNKKIKNNKVVNKNPSKSNKNNVKKSNNNKKLKNNNHVTSQIKHKNNIILYYMTLKGSSVEQKKTIVSKSKNKIIDKKILQAKKKVDKLADSISQIKIKDSNTENWKTDFSEDAITKRRNEIMSSGIADLIESNDAEKKIVDILNSNIDINLKFKKLKILQNDKNLKDERLVEIIFDTFYVDNNFMQNFNKSVNLLDSFCQSFDTQQFLLGCLESYIVNNNLYELFKDILYLFYDKEIIDEDVFVDWWDVPVTKFVTNENFELLRKEAWPFIEWLKDP